MKKTLSAAFIVAALALTSACGGGGGDRPSKGELADQIVKSSSGAITKKQADCAADAILKSDLSDEAVQAFADNKTDYKPSDEDTKAGTAVATDIGKCVAP